MYKEEKSYLGSYWKAFQRQFAESLSSDILLLEKINGYLIERSGKQLRPLLALLVSSALRGGCNDRVVRCATAAELLHTATLLHDDVADNSPERRGNPTVMALYSPTTAVLVGDFWLSRAIGLIVDHPDKRVLKAFSKCLEDLAEGEMLQLQKAGTLDTTEQDYRGIIYRKTASLFEAAVISSAYSVEASSDELEAVKSYAYHLGMSFQMMDDILDYSPELSIGKPTGQDLLEKKITLPLLGLFANAPAKVVKKILSGMKTPDAGLSAETLALVKEYGGLEFAREKLLSETVAAEQALAPLPDSDAKSHLVSLAERLAVRTA